MNEKLDKKVSNLINDKLISVLLHQYILVQCHFITFQIFSWSRIDLGQFVDGKEFLSVGVRKTLRNSPLQEGWRRRGIGRRRQLWIAFEYTEKNEDEGIIENTFYGENELERILDTLLLQFVNRNDHQITNYFSSNQFVPPRAPFSAVQR